jgi:hypothetical protein
MQGGMGWIGARGAPQEALGTWAATGHWMEWMRLTSWLCVCVRSRLLGSVWIMTTTSREVVLFEPTTSLPRLFQPFLGCSPVPLFWVGPRTTPPGLEQAHVRTTQPSTRLRKSPTEAQSAIQRALVWMDQPDEERRRADGMDPSSPQNPRDPEGPEGPRGTRGTPRDPRRPRELRTPRTSEAKPPGLATVSWLHGSVAARLRAQGNRDTWGGLHDTAGTGAGHAHPKGEKSGYGHLGTCS